MSLDLWRLEQFFMPQVLFLEAPVHAAKPRLLYSPTDNLFLSWPWKIRSEINIPVCQSVNFPS